MIFNILKFIIISGLIAVTIALVLIATNRPIVHTPRAGLDFSNVMAQDLSNIAEPQIVAMRDGYGLPVRHYGSTNAQLSLVVMIHGSGLHGMQFDGLARRLAAQAEILVPDLRGHGVNPARRGDIDYIGQFEDDLADLIKAKVNPGQKVVLLGHSSGGGLVVRFAGGAHGQMMDAAVLMAPFLKYNAPMTRENSGGWAYPLTRRIIGLSMLNMLQIKALNHLTIMQFRMPQGVLDGPLGNTATTSYSYRLNTGFAPRSDYLGDVAALPRFTVITGAEDEAFDAGLYAPTLSPVTDEGTYVTIDGVGHLDIVNAPQAADAIESLLNDL